MTVNQSKIAFKIVLVIFIAAIFLMKNFQPSPEEAALKTLENHLKNKYNEEFLIMYMAERSQGRYQALVYPKKYLSETRKYDEYYSVEGYVSSGRGGDNYRLIRYKESINEFFKPKLNEIFGKNILPVFDAKIYLRDYPTYAERLNAPGGYLDGAIYIFGSINNEKDVEKYQKGIFDFVQYLKETNSFESTRIAFIIIDERVLEDDFYDLRVKEQLIKVKEESKTENEFLVKRDKIMSQVKITSKEKSGRIAGINKGNMDDKIGHFKYFGYTSLMGTTVISSTMVKNNSIYEKMYPKEIGKSYEKKEEIDMDRLEKYFYRRN